MYFIDEKVRKRQFEEKRETVESKTCIIFIFLNCTKVHDVLM